MEGFWVIVNFDSPSLTTAGELRSRIDRTLRTLEAGENFKVKEVTLVPESLHSEQLMLWNEAYIAGIEAGRKLYGD